MNRRDFLQRAGRWTAAGLAAGSYAGAAMGQEGGAWPEEQPNIVLITCHDLGRHLGCYGIKEVKSPNIDGLAAKGVRFANAFGTSPVCSPARGSLLTGRYPQSNGLMGLTHAPWWWRFNAGEKHMAAVLAEAGYETFLAGLQHVFEAGEERKYGYQGVLTTARRAEDVVANARAFLLRRKREEGPFFLKVGFREVHRLRGGFGHREPASPVYVPPWLADTEVMRDDLARYQSEIEYFDARVGEVLAAVEQSEVARETIVVFTADHGIPYPGAKWALRGAGVDVALIMYRPGTCLAGGQVREELISHVDVLPTLFELAGVSVPENVQGVSFGRLLRGETDEPPRDAVFAQFTPHAFRDNESRSIRTARYKLVWYFESGRCMKYPIDVDPVRFALHTERAANTGGARPFCQLFDLEKDPYELEDIGQRPENEALRRELATRLYDEWMLTMVDDPLVHGPLVTPYYRKSIEAFESSV